MFDERLYILNKIMRRPIYPSYDELYIYENKRLCNYWLNFNGYQIPETHIFYTKTDFFNFISSEAVFPLIYKSNTGAMSTGVKIIWNRRSAKKIANKAFGLLPNTNLAKGYTPAKSGKILPITAYGKREKHSMFIQKFETIKWEWRIIKINDSYFGHRKLLKKYFASGTFLKEYGEIPTDLLFLVKELCERGNFLSMSVDIFETEDGRFLINELQSIFGLKAEHAMYIDGKPGRYVYREGEFIFEEGDFDRHRGFLLRVQHFRDLLSTKEVHV